MARQHGYLLGEVVIAALLAGLLLFELLHQPTGVWMAAPIVISAAYVAIIWLAKRRPGRARLIVLICPLSYSLPILALFMSSGRVAWDRLLVAAVYYTIGAGLLALHLLLNARRGMWREAVNAPVEKEDSNL